MKVVFITSAIILFFISNLALANIDISKVNINCSGSNECKNQLLKLQNAVRKYPSLQHFLKLLRLYMRDQAVKNFSYRVIRNSLGGHVLEGELVLNKRIIEIDIDEYENLTTSSVVLPIREGDFYDKKKKIVLVRNFTSQLQSIGYVDAQVRVKDIVTDDGVRIKVKVNEGRLKRISGFRVISKNEFIKELLNRKIQRFKGEGFDIAKLKTSLIKVQKSLVSYGYYPVDIKIKSRSHLKYKSEIIIDVGDDNIYGFDIKDNVFFSDKKIKDELKTLMVNLRKSLDLENLKSYLTQIYADKGFFDTKITATTIKFVDNNGINNIRYIVSVNEGIRYKITKIQFKGNDYFKDSELVKIFKSNGGSDILHGFHNDKYYYNFINLIKTKYLEKGFVSVLIEKPQVGINKKDKSISVEYRIREVSRSLIKSFKIIGVNKKLREELKGSLNNKEKNFFNPLIFEEDLKFVISYLRNKGYYYAKLRALKSTDLVKYNQDNSSVDIRINIDLDKKYTINNLIIIGNYKTRKKLIRRESGFKKGNDLTENAMRFAQTQLLALGLFSRVYIKPVVMGDKVDIFIDLEEKDFGALELAPGFRSDIGFKLSASLTYNNLDGMNKQVSVDALINRRTNLNYLDETRQESGEQLVEYQLKLNYSENHIFDSSYDYSASFSTTRKRYYSFDADIESINSIVTRNWNNWFLVSLKYQLEDISQYNATLEKDDGHFRIGAFTPGISLDFRDNQINPRKGAFLHLNNERASPAFGSQNNSDLEINFSSWVTRDRFYFPMGDVTLAMSAMMGFQENLGESGKSYIPNTKVFRLTGADAVRGYEDDEINRLESGEDISEVIVDDTAYMMSYKVEPRVFVTDKTILGVFYDAGAVFVNDYDFDDLRSSVGITFKYLTPVGTLDFDYGIKLLRKEDSDGNLESPGRLHVSIGFF